VVKTWSLYVVRAGDDSLYTGVTTDVPRRFAEHVDGGPRCARYLRGRGPLQLALALEVGPQGDALAAELRVKKLSRAQKEDLVRGRLCLADLGVGG